MKSYPFVFIIMLAVMPAALMAQPQKLTIIHTNDMHSHLMGFAPNIDYTPFAAGDGTKGGWARIKTAMDRVRAERRNPVLTVDGGDFLMGSLFHMITRERAPELMIMKAMGYDAVTLGNHEFDLKPAGLARILASAKNQGGLPDVVSSNVIFSRESAKDDTLEAAFLAGLVRPYTVIRRGGIKIGIFGLMGKNAAEVAPFASPVTFGDPVETAKKMVMFLRDIEKVDLVVCLSHGGIDAERHKLSEDVMLADRVRGIDIIVSGHTHTPLREPIVKNKTLIVQAWGYGLWMGVMDLVVDRGKVKLDRYRIVEINDAVPSDPAIAAMINGYKNEINGMVLAPHGMAFDTVLAHSDYDLKILQEECPLGNLVSDATRWYANKFVYDPRDPASHVDIAVDSNGLIRDHVMKGKTGNIAVTDLFNALPLGIGMDDTMGYPLIAVYVTAPEIKKAIEVLTSIYPLKGEDYFIQISGLKFTYNPRRVIFDRVTGVMIGSYETGYAPLDYSSSNKKLYRVAANLYNATFLKVVGDFTMNMLKIVPRDRNGKPIEDLTTAIIDADPARPGIQEVKQWVGLLEYVRSFKDRNGDGIPDVPEAYRTAQGRIVRQPSYSPVSLLRGGSYLTWLAFFAGLVVTAGVTLLAVIIVRKIRKK